MGTKGSKSKQRLQSSNLKWKVMQLRNHGLTTYIIGKLLGVSHQYVSHVLRETRW